MGVEHQLVIPILISQGTLCHMKVWEVIEIIHFSI